MPGYGGGILFIFGSGYRFLKNLSMVFKIMYDIL